MRAVRLHEYGRQPGLVVETIEDSVPGDDQLLIRVAAASVNPVDWKVVDGMLRTFMTFDLPLVPGGDVSGQVVGVGRKVSGFAAGDAVHAMNDTRFGYANGGFAELVAVTAANAAPKPASLDHSEAAAVPLAALTAWQALFDRGRLRAGERVLVHAAAGGVGGFAVQFAREAGAEVIGTASSTNLEYVRSLGAHQAVDYGAKPFEEQVADVDVVIDLVGGDVQVRSLALLRPGGRLVNAWGALAADEAAAAGVEACKVAVSPNGEQLRRIGAMIDAGRIRVDVAQRFPLDRVWEALDRSRRGHGRGKIVLEIG